MFSPVYYLYLETYFLDRNKITFLKAEFYPFIFLQPVDFLLGLQDSS